MKKLHILFNYLSCLIKKYFCICEKNDIYQECEEAITLLENQQVTTGENEVEEYLANYKSTTRWQTV